MFMKYYEWFYLFFLCELVMSNCVYVCVCCRKEKKKRKMHNNYMTKKFFFIGDKQQFDEEMYEF